MFEVFCKNGTKIREQRDSDRLLMTADAPWSSSLLPPAEPQRFRRVPSSMGGGVSTLCKRPHANIKNPVRVSPLYNGCRRRSKELLNNEDWSGLDQLRCSAAVWISQKTRRKQSSPLLWVNDVYSREWTPVSWGVNRKSIVQLQLSFPMTYSESDDLMSGQRRLTALCL